MEQSIVKTMKILSKKTDAFFSEDHFKLEFAIEINKLLNAKGNKFDIIPEYTHIEKNARGEDVRMIFDIMIISSRTGDKTAIEFKYKTRRQKDLRVLKKYEYSLANQAATNLARFDCWSDIERLEYERDDKSRIKEGYFLFITNVMAYRSSKKGSMSQFDMVEGKHSKGTKSIDDSVTVLSCGKLRKQHNLRFNDLAHQGSIDIRNDYDFHYCDFGSSGFKSLLVKIK